MFEVWSCKLYCTDRLVFCVLINKHVFCCADEVEKVIGLLLRDAGDRLNEKVNSLFWQYHLLTSTGCLWSTVGNIIAPKNPNIFFKRHILVCELVPVVSSVLIISVWLMKLNTRCFSSPSGAERCQHRCRALLELQFLWEAGKGLSHQDGPH